MNLSDFGIRLQHKKLKGFEYVLNTLCKCMCAGQVQFNMLLHYGRAERLRQWEQAEERSHRQQLS